MANKKIRYAVVGLSHIAQVAVLPAFQHGERRFAEACRACGASRFSLVLPPPAGSRGLVSCAAYAADSANLRIDAESARYGVCADLWQKRHLFSPLLTKASLQSETPTPVVRIHDHEGDEDDASGRFAGFDRHRSASLEFVAARSR